MVRTRHSSLALKPKKKCLQGRSSRWDALGFHGPAPSGRGLRACAAWRRGADRTQRHGFGGTHVSCGLIPFTRQEGFPEMQETLAVINLVKLLKSDLFKLIVGDGGVRCH